MPHRAPRSARFSIVHDRMQGPCLILWCLKLQGAAQEPSPMATPGPVREPACTAIQAQTGHAHARMCQMRQATLRRFDQKLSQLSSVPVRVMAGVD